MATSYSIIKVNENLSNNSIKNIFGINEISIEKKGIYDTFTLFECKIKKEITDDIFIYQNDNPKLFKSYFKMYSLDLFYFSNKNLLIIRGRYEARELLTKLLSKEDIEIKNILKFKDFCKIDLSHLLDKVEEMRTISIKDVTAKINKIKASGVLEKDNELIKSLIEEGSEITALTIEFPCNDEIIMIHIKNNCSLRIGNCDILSSIEGEAKFLYEFYNFIRGEDE